jgi:hypothetical protein
MAAQLTINYTFTFPDGEVRGIPLRLDESTLALDAVPMEAVQYWMALPFHQCGVCTLTPGLCPCCPTAVHLHRIADIFNAHNSYDEVTVVVDDGTRRFCKETTLQAGLGSMVGIIMATSGCPVLAPLRPMVRFHLPFASIEETKFRMVSMYLVAQYCRQQQGLQPDWSLQGLEEIYNDVRNVNDSFTKRIKSASKKDAGVNAIVLLDCFARTVPFAAKTMMRDFKKYFDAYSMME